MMLAVHVANTDNTRQIIERLRRRSAADIEQAKEKWLNGDRVDFDPTTPPHLVD